MKPVCHHPQVEDERKKNKTLIQVSVGVSIILHLLVLVVIAPKSTDLSGLGDELRFKPLVVELKEEALTQTPLLAPTATTKEYRVQRERPPRDLSRVTPDMEADARQKEQAAIGQFGQHGLPRPETKPLEIRRVEPAAPGVNQEQAVMSGAGGMSKRDLYGLAYESVHKEAREEALRERRQNELWRQAPSIMYSPPPPVTGKSGEPDETKNVFSGALKTAMKESQKEAQENVIGFSLSKTCFIGIKRFDRNQAEREARAIPGTPGVDKPTTISVGAHCKF